MPDRSAIHHPTAPPDIDAYLARFDWHPEPELIGYRDEGASRAALTELGAQTWAAALEFLYGTAMVRAMGDPSPYDEARRRYYGADANGPGAAPVDPTPAAAVIAEFSDRLAGSLMNAQHPRQFGYFTPPPLLMSIMGELLAQVANQGVDVWHAGPFAAFVEEEVVRWLCDIVGYGEGSFGLLTSGGVMANFMGMTLARDLHLGRLKGLDRPPRGVALENARVYTSDQTHFSIARALDELGFPPETLVVLPADDDFHLRGAAVAAAVRRDRAAGLTATAIASPGSTAPTRSPSTRTSGSSRRTTSVASWSATAGPSGPSSAGERPSTTAAARRHRPAIGRTGRTVVATTTTTSSTSTSSASRAPAAGVRSSCG